MTSGPLVAGTVEQRKLRVIEQGDDGAMLAPMAGPIDGLSANPILARRACLGLESSRSPAFHERLKEVAGEVWPAEGAA